MHSGGHEPRDVRHVHEEHRPDLLRYRSDLLERQDSRVRARTRDDHGRTLPACQRSQRIHVQPSVLHPDPIRHHVVQPAAEVDRGAVGQVSTMRQVHPQQLVARLQEREVRGHIGLRTAVWLNVCVIRPEQDLRTLASEILDDIHVLAATVVALARVALGVLVRQHRAHGLQNRTGDEVLTGDQLQALVLPGCLRLDGREYLGIHDLEVIAGRSNVGLSQADRLVYHFAHTYVRCSCVTAWTRRSATSFAAFALVIPSAVATSKMASSVE